MGHGRAGHASRVLHMSTAYNDLLAGERYVIGFAARDPNELTWVGGFRVNDYQP